ncbi:MAG: UDP-N-acetylmuramoyl-L-alanyl-D-glutamate--2,6-diaminopimelate ligase [Endomicrobium sp.]|jgi:UDP-N-acetylmuramoyl-L-alanyl-D-glutamate--2,6-diaminopimelate ligase|nr:UDP-N-acetylmuramoyl-L-alanyl-D-glutamate--2,6-diaminopimelate ligase [Endomicrobium sp.]
MKLKEILSGDNVVVIGDETTEVLGVSYDSRTVGKNYAFFALAGHNTDGSKYIYEAIEKGASVIITNFRCDIDSAVQVIVDDIFHFMSIFCAKFYNYPDRELNVVGVTGTNGKTTITYMIESVFASAGIECGVIGTVNYRYKGKIIEASNTTPQSLDIYKIMRQIVNSGIKYLVMEVSSHALSLYRVYRMDFDIAIFTNLTQDHLDFHKNMDNYFEAKSRLFRMLETGTKENRKYAIINADDQYGKKLSKMNIGVEKKLYSISEKGMSDFKAENIEITDSGSKFNIIFDNNKAKINIKHIGLHNVYNALAAFSASICVGIPFYKAVEGLNNSNHAPGRLEKIDIEGMDFSVVVDYAHTDDALKNVLEAIRYIKHERIITVFGAGGSRDRKKRPLMGKVAVEMSDFVFVTSDNPRMEDPNNIMLDIEVGIKRAGKNNYKVIVDREMAIKEAIMMANKGDIVLLAGKGHENYQIIGMDKKYFSDIEVAKKYVNFKKSKKNITKEIQQREFVF